MKIGFATTPSLGLALHINGQRFDLVDVEPYTRRDGVQTSLFVWAGECATCEGGFTTRSPALSLPETRRCEEHRRSGRRVRPQ